jgi:thioredoxin-like negative regulator of GroEL
MLAPCCAQVLDEISFVGEVIHADGVVVAAFTRGEDRVMEGRLNELCPLIEGRARVVRIDVSRDPGPASLYRVKSFPTLVFFRNGLEIGRLVGLRTAAQYALAVEITESALPGMETVRGGTTTRP